MSRILIIDDEKELVQLLRDELTARGHEVLAAYDGDDGVALAKQQPDLILLDIMMPGKDGFEVCRAIRDEVTCPILFLSAKQSEADRVRGLSIGGRLHRQAVRPAGAARPYRRQPAAGEASPKYQFRRQAHPALFWKTES